MAHTAAYNWYTQVGADYSYEMPRFGGFWTPEQQAVFREASPHHVAANFATPTLVVHGQRDCLVPVNHGFELYQALLQKSVPARLLYFNDENHWVLKPGNSLVWYREVRNWLDKYSGAPAAARSAGHGRLGGALHFAEPRRTVATFSSCDPSCSRSVSAMPRMPMSASDLRTRGSHRPPPCDPNTSPIDLLASSASSRRT